MSPIGIAENPYVAALNGGIGMLISLTLSFCQAGLNKRTYSHALF